jgi:hypothetical protein
MRLPQSFIRSFCVCRVHSSTVILTLFLLGMMPIRAGATVQQLTCSPSSLRFGSLDVGETETLLVTVTNNGPTTVTVSEITGSNSAFATPGLSLPLVLLAGQSVEVNVSFSPKATGWTGGTIGIYSNASNSTLALEVAGGGVRSESVTASPSILSFGQVTTGADASLALVLTNARSWKVTISGIQTIGSAFSTSGPAFPLTLAAGQSVTLSVTFAPQSAGLAGGSLFVDGPSLNIPLTGTGAAAGQLILAPAPLNFGDVAVGSTETQSITLSASGASVTVSSATSSGSQFVLEGTYFPLTIAAGQSLSFNVAFTPQISGAESGTLSFVSNASNSDAIEPLSGTGTVTQYSVSLYWNSSSDVVGYNVYRSTSASGSFAKVNSGLEANTAYTDSTVAAGQTYYYEATSVNSSGQESARSTPPVEAVVP